MATDGVRRRRPRVGDTRVNQSYETRDNNRSYGNNNRYGNNGNGRGGNNNRRPNNNYRRTND